MESATQLAVFLAILRTSDVAKAQSALKNL